MSNLIIKDIDDVDFSAYKEDSFDMKHVFYEVNLSGLMNTLSDSYFPSNGDMFNGRVKVFNYTTINSKYDHESGNLPCIKILTFDGKALFMCLDYGNNTTEYNFQIFQGREDMYKTFVEFLLETLLNAMKEEFNESEMFSPKYMDVAKDNNIELTFKLKNISEIISRYHAEAVYNGDDVDITHIDTTTGELMVSNDTLNAVVKIEDLNFKAFTKTDKKIIYGHR